MKHEQKLAFGTTRKTEIVAKPFSLAEILRASPVITRVVEMLAGDGVDCKVGKGFASFQFYTASVHSNATAQDIARAEYIATAVNGLRPKGMFEQVASVRGAAVSIDLDQLRKMRQTIEAKAYIDAQAVNVETHKAIEAINAIDIVIVERHKLSSPVQEGFGNEKSRAGMSRAAFQF